MAPHINGPLNWERLGKEGRPMAFVHPNPFDLSCCVYQMAHFSTWFRAIGIDLPGYGRSPSAQPGLTMPDVAQACWEAVDETTDEPAILVGLSVGSNVVLHMAYQRPQRTLAMIHSGCSYRPVKEFAFKRIDQYSQQGIAFRRQHAFEDYMLDPRYPAPRRFFATTGISVGKDGVNESEDATLAARNALLNMIDHLVAELGYSRQQAYALCSVAVDLKISELVDVPNFVVSAFLPLDIFV